MNRNNITKVKDICGFNTRTNISYILTDSRNGSVAVALIIAE